MLIRCLDVFEQHVFQLSDLITTEVLGEPVCHEFLVQIDVLVDSIASDGEFLGRTQWDAPDVDPMVFLTQPEDSTLAPLEIGQMRKCHVDCAMLFDLEAHPTA